VYQEALLCAAELRLRADAERSVRTRRAVSVDDSLKMHGEPLTTRSAQALSPSICDATRPRNVLLSGLSSALSSPLSSARRWGTGPAPRHSLSRRGTSTWRDRTVTPQRATDRGHLTPLDLRPAHYFTNATPVAAFSSMLIK
jgi:hypothetical protein